MNDFALTRLRVFKIEISDRMWMDVVTGGLANEYSRWIRTPRERYCWPEVNSCYVVKSLKPRKAR